MNMFNASKMRVLALALAVFGVLAAAAFAPVMPAQQPGAAPAAGSRGKQVYDAHCAECHGQAGKGDGAAAHLMTPRPRDFSRGRYKIRSTESGSVPTDDDLLRS